MKSFLMEGGKDFYIKKDVVKLSLLDNKKFR